MFSFRLTGGFHNVRLRSCGEENIQNTQLEAYP